jgi:hypothetical protein
LYTSTTQIQLVKNMLEILVPAIWTCFAVYTTWYFTSAKHYVPITRTEARALWHIHKQNVQCRGKKCKEIRRRSKIVGFECECGYKHFQKRPIVGNAPAGNVRLESPEYSAFDSLHTTYKSK